MKPSLSRLLLGTAFLALTITTVNAQGERGAAAAHLRYVKDGKLKETSLYDSSHALVIGMSKYAYWPALEGPKNDVSEVKSVLEEHGFKVQAEMDLTGEQLTRKLEQFVKDYGFNGNRRILVYFAGHGHTMKSPDGRDIGYIVPVDAPDPAKDELGFVQTAMMFKTVTNLADRILTKHSLFVFDSCFSGHLTTRSDGNVLPPSISEFLDKPVRQFITSGSASQKVPDDSTFRKFFVSGLRGGADTDPDGYITGTELYGYLAKRVVDERARKQTPTFAKIEDANLVLGDMVFFITKNAGDMSEEKLFDEAKKEDTVRSYRMFLNSNKAFKFTGEALRLFEEAQNKANTATNKTPLPQAVAAVFRAAPFETKRYEFNTITLDSSGGEIAKESPSAVSVDQDLGGGVTLRLVRISYGEFKMGSERAGENPIRSIKIPQFYMGVHEITKKQWDAVYKMEKSKISLPKNPAPNIVGDDMPVVGITWDEAVEFCERLSRHTGNIYELPSEAEWEYAARAGTDTLFAFGPRLKDDLANFDASKIAKDSVQGQHRNRLMPVGEFRYANKFGLFNMHGNAAEWVFDSWSSNYNGAPTDGKARVSTSEKKVIRGGSYALNASGVCSTCRSWSDIASPKVGFRIVLRSSVAEK